MFVDYIFTFIINHHIDHLKILRAFDITYMRIWRSLQEGEVCQESQEAGGPAVALHIQVCDKMLMAFIFDVKLAQLTRMYIIVYGNM